jgi:hypothetical protein
MAVTKKTYLSGQTARQLTVRDKTQSQGLNDSTIFGNVQFLEITDCDLNTATVLKIHYYLGSGVPDSDDASLKGTSSAPLGSEYVDTATGEHYYKVVAGWRLVTRAAD